jgi:hypothetical protein
MRALRVMPSQMPLACEALDTPDAGRTSDAISEVDKTRLRARILPTRAGP